MKLKWQWFLGGKIMFWVAIILFTICAIGFVNTYIIDPTTAIYMQVQSVDPTSIEEISEEYLSNLGITIDRDILYRFVRYNDGGYTSEEGDTILLGTFHEWNEVYYIDISVDLYKDASLHDVVIHETRHMIVEYLKDQKIIDLNKYTEKIAEGKNAHYNNLFNSGVYLLREKESLK